jgi:hypothetical protein
MKTLYYPKTYAVYLGRFLKDDKWRFSPTDRDYVHRFEAVDTKEIIEANHFGRSGSTPIRVKQAWYKMITEVEYRKALTKFGIMPIGTKVKLYQRQGSWYYRHMGQ